MNNGMAHIECADDSLRELALFAGSGGGILGGHLLGWRCVCAVEWEPYPAAVLAARQNEGILPPFPIWDDVQTFDGRPWRGLVDVVSGGFPCQDISIAGSGDGLDGERSGMWKHMARIIGEVRPRYALVENSPMLTSRGLGRVLGDLAELGYDAEWIVLGADDAGAPHRRKRIWILAYPDLRGCVHGEPEEQSTEVGEYAQRESVSGCQDVAHANGSGLSITARSQQRSIRGQEGTCSRGEPGGAITTGWDWWQTEPDVGRVADGVASRVDELKALGNGQVPAVVRLAWHTLHARINNRI